MITVRWEFGSSDGINYRDYGICYEGAAIFKTLGEMLSYPVVLAGFSLLWVD